MGLEKRGIPTRRVPEVQFSTIDALQRGAEVGINFRKDPALGSRTGAVTQFSTVVEPNLMYYQLYLALRAWIRCGFVQY